MQGRQKVALWSARGVLPRGLRTLFSGFHFCNRDSYFCVCVYFYMLLLVTSGFFFFVVVI